MTQLYRLLEGRRERVLSYFEERVRGHLAAQSLPRAEILNSLPEFLLLLVDTLRTRAIPPAEIPAPDSIAREHGEQRLRLGFDLDAVVREYGLLNDCILAVVEEEGAVLSIEDQRVLANAISAGCANATRQYMAERDQELKQQAAEHLGFLAHDLRDLLGSSLLLLGLLKRKQPAVTESPLFGRFEDSLKRQGAFIELALSQHHPGARLAIQTQSMVLGPVLEQLRDEGILLGEPRGITVTAVEGGDITLEVDLRLFRSAVTNLVRNAIKFSRDGSQVSIRARSTGGEFQLEVEDGCGGLPPGQVESLFTPWVQAGSDRSGVGLGLSIARQAAEAHGGSVRLRDLPGKGCIAVLSLPTGSAKG